MADFLSLPCVENDFLVDHVGLLLESYQRLTHQSLVDTHLSSVMAAKAIFEAPFVVLSHNTAEDPIFNYGNQTVLDLFEMTWTSLTQMPSRYSAEPLAREERERLLKAVAEKGFIDDYRGVRVSATGRRFAIDRATVWTVVDDQGNPYGQAATFRNWQWLP